MGWLQAHHGAPESFTCPRAGGLRSQLRDLAAVGHCRDEALALLGAEESLSSAVRTAACALQVAVSPTPA